MPFILSALFLTSFDPSILTVPILPPDPDPIEIKQLAFITKLAQCESGSDPTIKVWDTNDQWSYGFLQFQMKTWLKYQKLGTTKKNIYDKDLQIKVAKYMLDNPKETGGTDNWFTCSRPLLPYPSS